MARMKTARRSPLFLVALVAAAEARGVWRRDERRTSFPETFETPGNRWVSNTRERRFPTGMRVLSPPFPP